jgi:hypothetical protein
MKYLLVAILVASLSACETVKPWERGALAKPEMQWQTDVMEETLQAHIQYSKEASSGGSGAAGGGCGCN